MSGACDRSERSISCEHNFGVVRGSEVTSLFKFRVRVLTGLLLLGFLVVVCRLAQLQIWRCEQYRNLQKSRGRTQQLTPAPRGTITDREGRPLARDLPSFDLAVRVDALNLKRVRCEDVKNARDVAPNEAVREVAFAGLRERLQQESWVRILS